MGPADPALYRAARLRATRCSLCGGGRMTSRAELEAQGYEFEGNRAFRPSRNAKRALLVPTSTWKYVGPCPLPGAGVDEKEEQRKIRNLLVAYGCRVSWLSQARRTGQTRGFPDLWFFGPGHSWG